MKANVGSVDRGLRIVVGIVLLSLLFILEGNARWLGLIGIVLILTGAVSFCPLYAILGIKTRSTDIKGT